MPTLALAIGVVCLILLLLRITTPRRRLPPGPRGLPLLGNALQIPAKGHFLKFEEWGKQYGGIFMFTAVSQKIVVITDAHAAVEIMDKMATHTSGRPQFVMAMDLRLRNMLFSLDVYGERWRRHRRIAHESLNVRQAAAYHGIQERGSEDLIRNLVSDQSHLHDTLVHFSGSTTWIALYGDATPDMDEKIKRTASILTELFPDMNPTASLVNMFPILKYLPRSINKWKRIGDEFYERNTRFLLEMVQQASCDNSDATFVASCMKAKENDATITDTDIAWTTFGILAAGVDTVAFSLQFFIAKMVLNPDVVKKAQASIDAVVGNRLPAFEDRHKLVYVQAMVKELLRWRPVTPLGLPHVADADVEYDGYVIPKGAFITPDIWAMNHDHEIFPDPEAFVPERFLDADGNLRKPRLDYREDSLTFGFGRRICPGRDFAVNALYISVARLLWAFDFRKAVDENGNAINPSTTDFVDDNILIYPQDYKCDLVPRQSNLLELLSVAR